MSTARDGILWAAGLFEGEGYVQYNCNAERAALGTTDKWTAHRLQELFGGSVYQYQPKNPLHGVVYTWRCIGPRARGFLMSIYVLMSPRRKAQIRSVLLDKKTLPRESADKLKD